MNEKTIKEEIKVLNRIIREISNTPEHTEKNKLHLYRRTLLLLYRGLFNITEV